MGQGRPARWRGPLTGPARDARHAHPERLALEGGARFGFGAVIEVPLRRLSERAHEVEALGFDRFWLPDERLTRNVYSGLTVCALNTEQMELGLAVTNPYSRNPALTAAAAATVDEVSGGRFSLGLGAGGGLGHYGIERDRPAVAVRETVEVVRRLLDGDSVTFDGRLVRMRDARLDFRATRRVPVYIAARGPRLLELAGEIADGAIIGGFASRAGIAHAREAIRRGLERSGRDWGDIDCVAWLYTCVSDDPAAARSAVSRLVTTSLVTSRPILETIGVDIPARLRSCLEGCGWSVSAETMDRCSRHLSDEILDAFSVAGTPADCARKLVEVAKASDARELVMVAQPAEGQSVDDLARCLAVDVLPRVRAMLSKGDVV